MNMPSTSRARLDANWRAITSELDAPRPGRVERALRRVGVPARVSRVVVATPALRRAWFLSIGIAVLIGLSAARPDDPDSVYALLLLAPVVPVLGVALAFGPAADPMYEAQLASPMRGVRLVAIRALTVLAVSIVVITTLSLMSPATRPMAAAWLLPALGLTSASLAAMTVFPPRRAASLVAVVWFVVVTIVREAATDGLAAFGPVGQLLSVAVAVAGAVTIVIRRGSFDRLAYVS